jgi:hypothetical protein
VRAYLESFRADPPARVWGRVGTIAATAVGASLLLAALSAITLVLCAVLLGFALVIPELIAAGAGIVAIAVTRKRDVTVGLLGPLVLFEAYWLWFAAHFFHF